MNEDKKVWFCEKCNEFPDKVKEVYDWAVEERVWDGSCYAIEDSDYGNCIVRCAKCETELIEKEEVI